MEDEPVFLAKEEVRTLCYSSSYWVIMRRNYSIMRPTVFSANRLRQFLRRNRVATLPQLKQLLGTQADITVFRKLKELSYRTSYSHRGSFYTLDEIATFDERGLWSFDSVWFSRHGTLVATAEVCVTQAPAGYFASELEEHPPRAGEGAPAAVDRAGQDRPPDRVGLISVLRQQRSNPAAAVAGAAIAAGVSRGCLPRHPVRQGSDELRAAIVLFASLLDEQQRRLYAGLESLRLGGDRQIADLLHLDPHTVAKGRRQLMAQDVKVGRVRGVGGGRKRMEKKRPQ